MLPAAYSWLTQSLAQNADQPKMVAEALRLYGTHEGDGRTNSPVIMGWVSEIGAIPGKVVAGYVNDHTIPWCGLFAAHVAHVAGWDFPDHPLWAANWAGFGVKSPAPALGDVLVFERPGGGGHVGLYVAEDEDAFHVLGGNESDQVKIVRELKSRLKACRRPPYPQLPANVQPRHVAPTGALSTNEV